jgi:hypothetical protein
MWRHAKAFVIITFTLAFSTLGARAEAGHGCRYSIFVSRENIPGDQGARLCDVAEVVDWLRAVPGAEVSAQAPPGALNDGFTITVFLTRGFLYEPGPLPIPPPHGQLLTERVYPVAESGPVALVPSRSIFHGPGQYPRWVVEPGWRSIDASQPVPRVLARLGMSQPRAVPTTPTLTPTTAASPVGSSRLGPDLVTLVFLLAILVSIGAVVRRNSARANQQVRDGQGDQSEVPHRG